MIGSGIPKPLTKTKAQKIVRPAAMMSVMRHRKRVLAYALMITSSGRATTNPAPRTRKPKSDDRQCDQHEPLERKPTDRPAGRDKGSNHCNRADDGEHRAENSGEDKLGPS